MSNQLNQAREKLLNEYIKALEENTIPWHCGWDFGRPKNAISNKEYNGVNNMLLTIVSSVNEYKDNRWCTFKQANDNGWKIKKGEKSVPVEFWSIYNVKEKRVYTPREYNFAIEKDPKKQKEFTMKSRCYRVFNAEQIDGIPVYEQTQKEVVNSIEAVDKLIENMEVGYKETGNRAYYNQKSDMVVLPPKETFENDYYYNATKLHELCHATGHSSRLNRDVIGVFGTREYAKEELRAEISSSLLMQELGLKFNDQHIEWHKAYVQDWIKVLKDDQNELFKAIKEANKIVGYVEEKAELNHDKEVSLNKEDSLSVTANNEKMLSRNIEERIKDASSKLDSQNKEEHLSERDLADKNMLFGDDLSGAGDYARDLQAGLASGHDIDGADVPGDKPSERQPQKNYIDRER